MVLDKTNGHVEFNEPRFVASPATTRTEFLASALGTHAQISITNGPRCSWKLPEVSIGTERFHTLLYFHGEQLTMLSLAIKLPGESPSWSQWSETEELDRKRAHDRWLNAHIGGARTFPWGSVSSDFDPRSGGSSIVLSYHVG
jgi:hypothetical protein